MKGNLEWSPRSSDLTPKDYLLGDLVKKKVHESNRYTVQELKQYMTEVFTEIDAD